MTMAIATDIQPDEIPLQTNASPKSGVGEHHGEVAQAEFSKTVFGSVSVSGRQRKTPRETSIIKSTTYKAERWLETMVFWGSQSKLPFKFCTLLTTPA
jgi:hypothetical protein